MVYTNRSNRNAKMAGRKRALVSPLGGPETPQYSMNSNLQVRSYAYMPGLSSSITSESKEKLNK